MIKLKTLQSKNRQNLNNNHLKLQCLVKEKESQEDV